MGWAEDGFSYFHTNDVPLGMNHLEGDTKSAQRWCRHGAGPQGTGCVGGVSLDPNWLFCLSLLLPEGAEMGANSSHDHLLVKSVPSRSRQPTGFRP